VARTHYLGKSKRELVLAECKTSTAPLPNSAIVHRESGKEEAVGRVLQARICDSGCVMQVVLQTTETDMANLGLIDDPHARLTLIPFANA
jgi:tRNA-modifying protein YgfZ